MGELGTDLNLARWFLRPVITFVAPATVRCQLPNFHFFQLLLTFQDRRKEFCISIFVHQVRIFAISSSLNHFTGSSRIVGFVRLDSSTAFVLVLFAAVVLIALPSFSKQQLVSPPFDSPLPLYAFLAITGSMPVHSPPPSVYNLLPLYLVSRLMSSLV